MDPRDRELARILVEYSVRLQPGERVLVAVNGDAVPLAQAVVREVYNASSVCSGGTCSATPGVTLAGGLHKWYVHSQNEAGYGPIDTVASFVAANWASSSRCPGFSAAADFNGDGRADELCVNGDVTNVALGAGSGFGPASAWLDSALVAPLVADFNGDGKTDVAVYDRDARSFSVALSSGSAFSGLSSWGNAYATWSDGEVYGCGFHSTVGVGDKANPKAGAAGMLYIDDILFGKPKAAGS